MLPLIGRRCGCHTASSIFGLHALLVLVLALLDSLHVALLLVLLHDLLVFLADLLVLLADLLQLAVALPAALRNNYMHVGIEAYDERRPCAHPSLHVQVRRLRRR